MRQLAEVDARIRAAKAAPSAINLELRRMEAEVKKRIADLGAVLERNPEEARAVVAALFSKLTADAGRAPLPHRGRRGHRPHGGRRRRGQ